jgi:RimJ/RimL family protein N-acetyltransferase
VTLPLLETPVLETPRLLLRAPELCDLDRWAELMANEASARYIGGTQARSMVWRSLMAMRGAWHLTGVSMFSVIEKASGLWVGRIGPWQPDGWPGTEVGWSVHPEAQGKGIAYEASVLCMNYAVEVLGWQHIIHTIEHGNVRSQQLATRLGSKHSGETQLPAPFQHVNAQVWSQSAEQWRARQRMDCE